MIEVMKMVVARRSVCSATMVVLLVIACIGILNGCAFCAGRQFVLKSPCIEFSIDAENGRIVNIANRQTKEEYAVLNDDCRLDFDAGSVVLSQLPVELVSKSRNSYQFKGRSGDIEVVWTYTLSSARAYVDRSLSVKNTGKQPLILRSVKECSLEFGKPFASYLFHKDVLEQCDPKSEWTTGADKPSLYSSAINVFMRNASGGLCVGLKYPYFNPNLKNDNVELTFEANIKLKPGETMNLPVMFCGVYKNTGYTCRKELHWTPRILSTQQEEMDWGEVRAMQAIMRDYLPEYPTGFKGYSIWLNSWWANHALANRMGAKELEEYKKLLVNLKQSKCIDMLGLAPVWCGWSGYLVGCPEIDAIGADAKFPLNEYISQLMAASKSTGIPINGFCEPFAPERHYRKDRPEWCLQPTEDPTKSLNMKCQANDEYSDWFYRLICSTIDTCDLKFWSWDFGWIFRPMMCYSTAHGHEPGNCEFQQNRNITGIIQKLRQKYPTMFLEIYWGLKEGGPWALRGLNSLENAYEMGSPAPPKMTPADDMRFQHWYNHNYRFIPTYMNLAQMNMNKNEPNGHMYSLLSCLSASTHGSLTEWVPFETDSQADEIFGQIRKWKAWATKNMPYLRDRVDIFGQPCRKNGIDGTAHIIRDRGFIFVFNPCPGHNWGSIPLNELIGLNEGSRFSVDEISTGEKKRLGVYEKDEQLIFPIAGKSAMLIELKPSTERVSHINVPTGVYIQPAFTK